MFPLSSRKVWFFEKKKLFLVYIIFCLTHSSRKCIVSSGTISCWKAHTVFLALHLCLFLSLSICCPNKTLCQPAIDQIWARKFKMYWNLRWSLISLPCVFWCLQVTYTSTILWILNLMFWSLCILHFNHQVLWKVWGNHGVIFSF